MENDDHPSRRLTPPGGLRLCRSPARDDAKPLRWVTAVAGVTLLFLSAGWVPAQTPSFAWVQQMGGSISDDTAWSVATDQAGNIFVAGDYFSSAAFGTAVLTNFFAGGPGSYGAFLAKYDLDGRFAWVRGAGSGNFSRGRYLAMDPSGNVVLAGEFLGQLSFSGVTIAASDSYPYYDAFIVKFSTSGSALWGRRIVGPQASKAIGSICAGGDGAIYVSGSFTRSTDFGGTILNSLGCSGCYNPFHAKYTPSGDLAWVRQIGTTNNGGGYGTAVDEFGNSYLLGALDRPAPEVALTNSGLFIVKYDSSGSVIWARQPPEGTNYSPSIRSLSIDVAGNLLVFGRRKDNLRGIVSKFDPSGNQIWSRNCGDFISDGVADSSGNVFVCGEFYDARSFDLTNIVRTGQADLFAAAYDPVGNLLWIKEAGGSSNAIARALGIALDASRNILLAGDFSLDCRFDTTNLTDFRYPMDSGDAFLAKVVAPNQCPVASNLTVTVTSGSSVNFQLPASDADGDALRYNVSQPPQHGVLTVDIQTGASSYQPFPTYCGPDSFKFTANDGACASPEAAVSISVSCGLAFVSCPSNIVTECTGSLTPVTYTVTATNTLGAVPVACTPPSGTGFRFGVGHVVCVANDGNVLSCSFAVTVQDTTPPSVTCNSNRVVDATSRAGADVSYSAGTLDACEIRSLTCTPPGNHFPIGVTTVTCVGVDNVNNTNSCSFTVTVQDTRPIFVDCPTNIVIECTGELTPVTYTLVATNVLRPVPVTCVPPSGTGFRLGASNVGCTATGSSGTARCSFIVTVQDTQPPTVDCSTNLTMVATNPAGAVATYVAGASDACGLDAFDCSPPSGSTFPVGANTVICTARDTAGHMASCTFVVTVLGARSQKTICLDSLSALRAGATNSHDQDELDGTIEHLVKSLDPKLWVDENHLVHRGGEKVFDEERNAVHELSELLEEKKSSIADATLEALIDCLVQVDRLLAVLAVNEAEAAGVKVAEDRKEIADGDNDAARNKPEDAIHHYHDAWKHAVHIKIDLPHHFVLGGTHLTFMGVEGETYVIQASSDMIYWSNVGSAQAGADGVVAIDDPGAADESTRYYRVLRP